MPTICRPAVMIDDPSSRDLDDAFTVAAAPSEGWTATIHLALPALVIHPDSEADRRARARITTKYRPTSTVPMLGTIERQATLSETEDRHALSVTIDVDRTGEVTATALTLTELPAGSCTRLSYSQVPHILTDHTHPMHTHLATANQLAQTLLTRRTAAGALAVYDLIHGYTVTEDGAITEIPASQRTVGYIIVAELMIAAGSAAATWAIDEELPILFRNHRTNLTAGTGADLAADIAASLHDQELFAHLQRRTIRTLGKATYAATPRGHHALRLEAYTHITSPLRRYPDLVNQRIVHAHLTGQPAPYTPAGLDSIATDINTRIHARKLATEQHFKNQDRKVAARNILDRNYESLDQKQWRKTFDLMTKTAPAPGIDTELHRRLTSDLLVPNDLARLAAAGPAWTPIRTRLFPAVRAVHPEFGPSALAGRTQLLTTDPVDTDMVTNPDKPGHQTEFAVRARSGPHIGQWCIASTKKAAYTQATWELLDVVCGHRQTRPNGDRPQWPTPPPTQHDPKTPPPSTLPPTARHQLNSITTAKRASAFANPVAWLANFATTHNLGVVDYQYDTAGPSHAPTFTCTAVLAGATATGTAPAKAPARVAAATELLHKLIDNPSVGLPAE